jgi:hypothetical protein
LEKLHPEMFREFKLKPPKLLTDKKEYQKRKNEEYRQELNSDFNLLREWLPGTTKSSRTKLLKKTVNYIQELQKKIKELETSQTPQREPYPSEPVKTFAITLMKKITTMDAAVQTTSEDMTPEEVGRAEKELLVRPEDETSSESSRI